MSEPGLESGADSPPLLQPRLAVYGESTVEPTTGLISTVIEAIKSGQKFMFILWTVSFVLIVGSEAGFVPGRMDAFVNTYWAWLFIALIGSSAFFVFEFLSWARSRYGNDDGVPRPGKHLDKTLEALTEHERSVLWDFIRKDCRTLKFPARDPALRTLIDLKLIACPDGMILGSACDADCIISTVVWDHLQKKVSGL